MDQRPEFEAVLCRGCLRDSRRERRNGGGTERMIEEGIFLDLDPLMFV